MAPFPSHPRHPPKTALVTERGSRKAAGPVLAPGKTADLPKRAGTSRCSRSPGCRAPNLIVPKGPCDCGIYASTEQKSGVGERRNQDHLVYGPNMAQPAACCMPSYSSGAAPELCARLMSTPPRCEGLVGCRVRPLAAKFSGYTEETRIPGSPRRNNSHNYVVGAQSRPCAARQDTFWVHNASFWALETRSKL